MSLMVALACIKMKMTPEEALSAATLNGAAALELSDTLGSIEKGKIANLIVTKPMHAASFIPYNFGHNPITQVILNGNILNHA
jgi:imidazolonepropionase